MENAIWILSIALGGALFYIWLMRTADFKWERVEVNKAWRAKAQAICERDAAVERLENAFKALKGEHLTFAQLRFADTTRSEDLFPECAEWTARDWMTALCGEVGEAANFIKKELRDGKDVREKLTKELADIIMYTDLLGAHYGIDLEAAIEAKFNEVVAKKGGKFKLKDYRTPATGFSHLKRLVESPEQIEEAAKLIEAAFECEQRAAPGTLWMHKKGGVYEVLHCAQHTETKAPLTIYRRVFQVGPEYDEVWARPTEIFEDGRFTNVKEEAVLDMLRSQAKSVDLRKLRVPRHAAMWWNKTLTHLAAERTTP